MQTSRSSSTAAELLMKPLLPITMIRIMLHALLHRNIPAATSLW